MVEIQVKRNWVQQDYVNANSGFYGLMRFWVYGKSHRVLCIWVKVSEAHTIFSFRGFIGIYVVINDCETSSFALLQNNPIGFSGKNLGTLY